MHGEQRRGLVTGLRLSDGTTAFGGAVARVEGVNEGVKLLLWGQVRAIIVAALLFFIIHGSGVALLFLLYGSGVLLLLLLLLYGSGVLLLFILVGVITGRVITTGGCGIDRGDERHRR